MEDKLNSFNLVLMYFFPALSVNIFLIFRISHLQVSLLFEIIEVRVNPGLGNEDIIPVVDFMDDIISGDWFFEQGKHHRFKEFFHDILDCCLGDYREGFGNERSVGKGQGRFFSRRDDDLSYPFGEQPDMVVIDIGHIQGNDTGEGFTLALFCQDKFFYRDDVGKFFCIGKIKEDMEPPGCLAGERCRTSLKDPGQEIDLAFFYRLMNSSLFWISVKKYFCRVDW